MTVFFACLFDIFPGFLHLSSLSPIPPPKSYVGNKSAVFPLQVLGLDVDPINSVQFSNHTGYDVCKGDVLEGVQLLKLVEGLEANGLLSGYTHLLTGYIGSPSFLHAVVQVATKLKALNPGLQYVCDPVLGDEGKLYVAEALVETYKTQVLPLADVLTPNQFEAEILTGIKIQSESDAQRACLLLHAHGPRTVVVTSAAFRGGEGCLHVLGSQRAYMPWGVECGDDWCGVWGRKGRPYDSETRRCERGGLVSASYAKAGTVIAHAFLTIRAHTDRPWDLLEGPRHVSPGGASHRRGLHGHGGLDCRLALGLALPGPPPRTPRSPREGHRHRPGYSEADLRGRGGIRRVEACSEQAGHREVRGVGKARGSRVVVGASVEHSP